MTDPASPPDAHVSEEIRAEAERLLKGITSGPWAVKADDEDYLVVLKDNLPGVCVLATVHYQHEARANAKFFAASPRLVRQLLGAYKSESLARERLEARASRLEDAACHFQSCRTCADDGEDSCPSGKRFAAYLRGEDA